MAVRCGAGNLLRLSGRATGAGTGLDSHGHGLGVEKARVAVADFAPRATLPRLMQRFSAM